MHNIELLRLQAEAVYKEMLESIEGVSEQQAWARVECQPDQYLHTEGSIYSIVAHVAACKFIYGSCAYRNLEVRWRDTLARLEGFWPSWNALTDYLAESHKYWMDSWEGETDVEREVMRFDGNLWKSCRIIWTVTHHDSYHAGQIQVLRSTLAPSATPPPSEADEWKKYCADLPSW